MLILENGRRSPISSPYCKELEKRNDIPKQVKEMVKIRAETSEVKIRKRQRKINKTKNWLFEKIQWSLQASTKTDKKMKKKEDTRTESAAVGFIITKLLQRKVLDTHGFTGKSCKIIPLNKHQLCTVSFRK